MHEDQQKTLESALRWHSVLSDVDVSNAEHRAFGEWLTASPANAAAFDATENYWRSLETIDRKQVPSQILEPSLRERILEWLAGLPSVLVGLLSNAYRAAGAAAVVAGVMVAWFVISTDDLPVDVGRHEMALETLPGEVREFSLADGSVITLGAASEALVLLNGDGRSVTLKSGEAYFDVETDTERPFRVVAGNLITTVTGTEFDVRVRNRSTQVSIAEGSVNVSYPQMAEGKPHAAGLRNSRTLTAGQSILALSEKGLGKPIPIKIAEIGNWRSKRLAYFNTSLAEIVSDLERYHNVSISVLDDRAASLPVSLVFDDQNIETLMFDLSEAFPLEITTSENGDILIGWRD